METPQDEAGLFTEMVMFRAKENIERRNEPKLTTGQYNSVYEAVYDTLSGIKP